MTAGDGKDRTSYGFRWSVSRHRTFNTCLRRYFLQYYGDLEGSSWSEDSKKNELHIMRRLHSTPTWIGYSLHDNIQWIIHRLFEWKKPVGIEEALKRLRRYMDYEWYVSNAGIYKQEPWDLFGLREHYYQLAIGEDHFKRALEKAEHCMVNFFDQLSYKWFLADPSVELVSVEEFNSTKAKQVPISLKSDLIVSNDGKYWIIDWKTGSVDQGDDLNLQLATYALHVRNAFKVNLPDITIQISDLDHGEEIPNQVSKAHLNWAEGEIIQSATSMTSMLDNNTGLALEENFPKAGDEFKCLYCNFLAACN